MRMVGDYPEFKDNNPMKTISMTGDSNIRQHKDDHAIITSFRISLDEVHSTVDIVSIPPIDPGNVIADHVKELIGTDKFEATVHKVPALFNCEEKVDVVIIKRL